MLTTSTIYNSNPLSLENDAVVTFDFACYNTTVTAGDGFCVFFVDSQYGILQGVQGGGLGPGLGYNTVQNVSAWTGSGSTVQGVVSGSLGVGFDLTGNFSLSSYGINGNNVPIPNSISLRGSALSSYDYIYTTASLSSFPVPLNLYQSTTATPIYYRARVRLADFGMRIVVDVKQVLTNTEFTNYLNYTLPYQLPKSVICALSFSAGPVPAIFKINNFTINGKLGT